MTQDPRMTRQFMNKILVLGSTSPYRKELLQRLGIPFETEKPLIDEESEKDPSLSPRDLAVHLAFKKAQSLAVATSTSSWLNSRTPQRTPADEPPGSSQTEQSSHGPGTYRRIILGGDQLVSFEGRILGKPGTREKAISQLEMMSGKAHELVTAICLLEGSQKLEHVDITRIQLKNLSRKQIEKVVDLDQPFDCAGSYKIEKHGIALIEKIETEDFTAIQGLPLLALSRMLRTWEIETP